jgi:hypothetical protein
MILIPLIPILCVVTSDPDPLIPILCVVTSNLIALIPILCVVTNDPERLQKRPLLRQCCTVCQYDSQASLLWKPVLILF